MCPQCPVPRCALPVIVPASLALLPTRCTCRARVLCVTLRPWACPMDVAADVDDGEEVSEPTMFLRRYAGHLNLSATAPHDGPPLAPQLAFLGHHSGELMAVGSCARPELAMGSCARPELLCSPLHAWLPCCSKDAAAAASSGRVRWPVRHADPTVSARGLWSSSCWPLFFLPPPCCRAAGVAL